MSTIGFVGLGAMGSRVAGRLLDAGNTVYGTDLTRSQPLIDRGLVWRDSPREVAAAAEVVFSMVTDDAAVRAITSGPDGILAGLARGKVYIDMSTISPQASREVAEQVRAAGAEMLDAPVSGSIPQAENGTLAIMVGGEEHAFRVAEPLLREVGQTVTHVGTNGQGLLLKLAINISLAVQTLAFSEGLAARGTRWDRSSTRGRGDEHQLHRVTDAQGARSAAARPSRASVVRRNDDAQGHPPCARDG